jgi:hypothetical protein
MPCHLANSYRFSYGVTSQELEPSATPLWQTKTSQVYTWFHAADFLIWVVDNYLNPDTERTY